MRDVAGDALLCVRQIVLDLRLGSRAAHRHGELSAYLRIFDFKHVAIGALCRRLGVGQSLAKERKITLFVSRSVSPGKCKLELCKAADVFARCAQCL